MVSESPGRNESEPIGGLDKNESGGRAFPRKLEVTFCVRGVVPAKNFVQLEKIALVESA
jgi:hypothetical protein